MPLLKHPLPYCADSATLFAGLSHKPWALFLDSGQPGSQYGRFDIIVADPFITLCTIETADGVQTEVVRDGKATLSIEDPFALLAELLQPYKASAQGHPFTGGAVGYFSYDLARQVEQLPEIARKSNIPHMQVGIYDWAVVVDHREKVSYLLSNGFHASTHAQWPALCALFENPAMVEQAEDFKLTR
jgi:para-aminobenzoate synthetase component 1